MIRKRDKFALGNHKNISCYNMKRSRYDLGTELSFYGVAAKCFCRTVMWTVNQVYRRRREEKESVEEAKRSWRKMRCIQR